MDTRATNTLKLFGVELEHFKSAHPTARDVQHQNIKVVVADPEWQELRSSFVGTWKDKQKSAENVLKLRQYLGAMDDPLKIRRVLNYLTGSAFRIGIISSDDIIHLREEVRHAWSKVLVNP